jgi:hypothetical protein
MPKGSAETAGRSRAAGNVVYELAKGGNALFAFDGSRLEETLEIIKLHAIGAHYHGDQGVAKGFGYGQVVSGLAHGSFLLSWAVARVPLPMRCLSALTFARSGVTGK